MPDSLSVARLLAEHVEAVAKHMQSLSGGGFGATELKGSHDPMTEADRHSQLAICNLIVLFFGKATTFLAEEDDPALLEALRQLYPQCTFVLPEEHVPADCWVIDPIDGTQRFIDGSFEWGISVARIIKGEPYAAISIIPGWGCTLFAGRTRGTFCVPFPTNTPWTHAPLVRLKKRGVRRSLKDVTIGVDWQPQTPSDFASRIYEPLRQKCRLIRNDPSVASGVAVAKGLSAAWIGAHSKVWDVAGTALLIQECGGVAECLDGSAIPFDRVRMPPLLFAENREMADEIRAALA